MSQSSNLKKESLVYKNLTYSFYKLDPNIHEEAYDVYVDKYYGLYPTRYAMNIENIYQEFGAILKMTIGIFILIN